MTLVAFDVRTASGPAAGTISARPYRARQDVDGYMLVREDPAEVELAQGLAELDLEPTGGELVAWELRYSFPRSELVRVVLVPDVPGPVPHADLVDVNPATLEPDDVAPASWDLALGALLDRVEELEGAAPIPDLVLSVNGKTGEVVLVPADVGAQPAADNLALLAALTFTAGRVLYSSTTGAITTLATTVTGRALMAASTASAARVLAGITEGTVAPEGTITALSGSYYFDTTAGRLWLKQSGTGNTGWVGLSKVGEDQPLNANLSGIAALPATAHTLPYLGTGGVVASTALAIIARPFLGASSSTEQRSLIDAPAVADLTAEVTARTAGDASLSATLSGLALGGTVVDVYTTPGAATWTKPAGALAVHVVCISGGAGGGSGRRGAAGTIRCGGGGGGGGAFSEYLLPASALGATEPLNVGTGTAGGPAQTVDDTDGIAATVSTSALQVSQFGTLGTHASAWTPVNGKAGTASTGLAGAGAAGKQFGGAGGAASTGGLAGAVGNSGASGGGGAGGGLTAANAQSAGGTGGYPAGRFPSTPLAGIAGGGAGAHGSSLVPVAVGTPLGAHGGGGGGSNAAGAGGRGGDGARYGSGGGGGGASVNGFDSGAGGDGGPGIVVVTTLLAGSGAAAPAWIPLDLSASPKFTAAIPSTPPNYRLRDGMVELSGIAVALSSVTASGDVIATLPPGYRPTSSIRVNVYNRSSGALNPINVGTDGTITVVTAYGATGQQLQLDGAQFRAYA